MHLPVLKHPAGADENATPVVTPSETSHNQSTANTLLSPPVSMLQMEISSDDQRGEESDSSMKEAENSRSSQSPPSEPALSYGNFI